MNKCPKCLAPMIEYTIHGPLLHTTDSSDCGRIAFLHAALARERRVGAALVWQLADVACGHCRTVESSACDTCPIENMDLVRRKAETEAGKGPG